MKHASRTFALLAAIAICVAWTAHSEELTGADVIAASQAAFYYQADDMKATVRMELIGDDGRTRTRVMAMLRLDVDDEGDQKYFMYFHEPGDVRRMTFMGWKYPEEDDDRWIFIPAVDLIRAIAADDKRSSFVGSDFTYEDISGREVDADAHTLVHTETLDGRECYVVESVPVDDAEYTKRAAWIDTETFLPIKEEYYDAQGSLFRVFTADEIKSVMSSSGETFPTVVKRTMRNLKTGHRTEVTFEDIVYDLGLDDDDFSERNMRKPPRDWIR